MEQEERWMHRRMKGMQVGPDERGSQFIIKFNGTHFDWFRFWNQFESDIEKSQLSPVSNFSYLKELVSQKFGHS